MARVPRWTDGGTTTRAVLTRIDGNLDVEDIAALAGVEVELVDRVLAAFLHAGMVQVDESTPEGVQLSAEERRRINELYDRINDIDHYTLLGVAATADVKTIKRAYFAKAKVFHPDRLFRKDVGVLRVRVEAVFTALTTAHDTLTDTYRRADYDEYLRDVLRTRITRKKAEQLEAEGDWEAAADAWSRVAAQLPADAFVLHRYATALLRTRRNFDGAIALALRAKEIDPTRAEYHLTLASLYLATGRDRGAVGELEVAATVAQDRGDVADLLAAVSERVARRGV